MLNPRKGVAQPFQTPDRFRKRSGTAICAGICTRAFPLEWGTYTLFERKRTLGQWDAGDDFAQCFCLMIWMVSRSLFPPSWCYLSNLFVGVLEKMKIQIWSPELCSLQACLHCSVCVNHWFYAVKQDYGLAALAIWWLLSPDQMWQNWVLSHK